MTSVQVTQDTIESVSAFFSYVDADKDGFVTRSEIEKALAVDYNQDGSISNEEQVKAGAQWINNGPFQAQDLNLDDKITLAELLAYNAKPAT